MSNDARKRRDTRRKAFMALCSSLTGFTYAAPVINFGANAPASLNHPDGAFVTMNETGTFRYQRGTYVRNELSHDQVVYLATVGPPPERVTLTASPVSRTHYEALKAAGRFGYVGGIAGI